MMEGERLFPLIRALCYGGYGEGVDVATAHILACDGSMERKVNIM